MVNTKAKIDLKSSIMVQNTDFCCSRSHYLFQNTFVKVQTQGLIAQKSKPKEFRPKNLKSINENPCFALYQ